MNFKVIFFLILSSSVYAQEVKVGFTKSYNLILRSNSCEQLIENREAICSWKQTLGEDIDSANTPQCREESNGQKRIIVSSCLPKFVKENHRRKLYKHGANCWGTAMNFKKLSLKPRFVWGKEMVYWMNSPICRKLEVGEEKQPGDILNIYGPEYKFEVDETTKGDKFWNALFPGRFMESPVKEGYTGFHNFLHSETFITNDITFGKDSPNKGDRFDIHPMNEVYGRSRSEKCQERQDLSPHSREYGKKPDQSMSSDECRYFSLAYRCENVESYFSNINLNVEETELVKDIEKLKSIQQDLFALLRNYKANISSKKISELLKLADTNSSLALKKLTKRNFSKTTEMLLTLKYFSAEGIRKSLELADLTEATERL